MMRPLTLRHPIAQTKVEPFRELEGKLIQKYETELAANRDTNTNTGPYVRTQLILQLLTAKRDDPRYVDELTAKFPSFANEIAQAAQELASWTSPLDVRAQNMGAVADQLTWPGPGQIANTLTTQAQSGNAEYRARVATDLIARMRLVKNDAYSSIETALPQIFPQARLLAARINKEEYPLFRLELLSLPLADQNRIYYIRNLAIDIQALMSNNNEGRTIRNAVHNSAGPANVPLVGSHLVNYFAPDDTGNTPDADAIARLMLARRWIKAGDLSSVREITGELKRAFAGREPSIERALSARDPQTALVELESFIRANVRLDDSLTHVVGKLELVPSNGLQPVSPETCRMIADCAQAIGKDDAATALQLANQVGAALQAIGYQHNWVNVQSTVQTWANGNPSYRVNASQNLAQFLQAAKLPSRSEIRTVIAASGQPPSEQLVDRVAQLFSALAQDQLDTVYQQFPQLLADLNGTGAYQNFSQYSGYVTPAYRNQYNARTILDWLLPSFRTNQQPLQGGSSNNATYSSMDVYEKLAELYEEISALYNSKSDIAMLEHSFPMWAPRAVREGLHRVTAHLAADDRLHAAKEMAELRRTIRGEILPDEGPRAELLSVLKESGDRELKVLAAEIAKDPLASIGKLEDLLAKRSRSKPITRSRGEVVAINNQNEAGLTLLNEMVGKLIDGDAEAAQAKLEELTPHFVNHPNFSANIGTSLYHLQHFLAANGAQQLWKLGSLKEVPPLKPDAQGQVPNAQGLAALSALLDRVRANDPNGVQNAWGQIPQYFQSYPNYATTLAHVGELCRYQPVLQLAPFIEEFIEHNRGATDDDVEKRFKLGDRSSAPPELSSALVRLRAHLYEPSGQENLRLIQLDGLLEDISTNLFASLGEELAEVDEKNLGAALVALKAALDSAIAGGLPDVKSGGVVSANRMLTPFGLASDEPSAALPEMRELSRRLEALTSKETFREADVAELRTVADQISERVWQTYVDLRAVFQPRLDLAQAQQGVGDPAFVDNLIKQGPLTHLKAIADAVHDFAARKLGSSGSEVGAVLENPKGVRVMSEGRAVLKRIVIAQSLRDVPRKVVLDENTLLILGTVGNDNISMAGSVVVNRAKADGSGAGGQFSHIFVWTRNTGIAGVALENATQVVGDFQEKFADRLAEGEEIYLEAGREGFRLATVSEAIERGWMKAEEKEELRPGINSFVRFMVPDGNGKTRAHLPSIRMNQRRPNKPFLEIELAYPMARLNHLGDAQLSFAEMMNAGPNGAHAESLVGPKAAVLARARQQLNWQHVVFPGQAMPFGQVCRLLEESGAIDAIRRIEPAMGLDSTGFWASELMNDGAYRARQCDAIQRAIREKLRAHLFEEDGKTLTAAAKIEIIDPLKANPELLDANGKLKPLIARSTANSEDSADFNAAGKHKTVANLLTEEAIVEAAIEVIASLHNLEAMETRRLFGVDTRLSAMSVLFQPIAQPEVSGVLVTRQNEGPAGVFAYQATRGLFGGVHGDAQIQVSELGANTAERKVVVPYQASKMTVLDPINGGVVEQPVPEELQRADNLMTPAQEQTLYGYAQQLKQFFNQHVYPGENLDLDIEFIVEGGQVIITQARPLPRPPAVQV